MKSEEDEKTEELEELYRRSKARLLAAERRSRKTPEELETEYANLKAIFAILETDDFKYTDFENISYINDYDAKEVEIFSAKHKVHKLVTYAVFIKTFRISPYYFVEFMKENGAINERAPKKETGYITRSEAAEALAPKGPKAGKYYLDPDTGFWKIATKEDVANFEKKRKEAIYARFDEIFFNEQNDKLIE